MGILDSVAKTVGTVAGAVSGVVSSIVGEGTEENQQREQQQPPQPEAKRVSPNVSTGTIKVQYYKSFIGQPAKQKNTVRGLGFKHLNQTLVRPDNLATRGVVNKVPHLLRIVE